MEGEPIVAMPTRRNAHARNGHLPGQGVRLRSPDRAHLRLPLHVGRLLIPLTAAQLTLQPRTLHQFPKPTNGLLNRLSLPQHNLDQNSYSCRDLSLSAIAKISPSLYHQ